MSPNNSDNNIACSASPSSVVVSRKRPLVTTDDEPSGNKNDNNYYDNMHNTEKNEGAATTTPTTSSTPSETTSTTDTAADIDDLTQQMGKLWWPTSNQDLTRIYERDKFGRLITPSTHLGKRRAGASSSCNDAAGSASDGSDTGGGFWNTNQIAQNPHSDSSHAPSPITVGADISEDVATAEATSAWSSLDWYDRWIASAQSAKLNLVGHFWNGPRKHSPGEGNHASEEEDEDDEAKIFEQMDPKLRTSMALATTIDKFWSRELYEMDAGEREDILNEIHGIPNRQKNRTLHETPQSIEAAVGAFRKHLRDTLGDDLDNGDSIVPPVNKDPCRRAIYDLQSDYVISHGFLLKFLRISNYDTEAATLRYFRYLDLLVLLFGDIALTRPLALQDLTKREMRYLKKGQMQLLPSRDRAGRRIYAFSGCDDTGFNIREKYRCNIYLIDVVSDDITTQKLGLVSLNAPRVRPRDTTHPFGFEGMTLRMGKQELLGGKCTEAQFFRKINEAVPIRFSAMHYFAPQTIIYNIGKAMILTLLGKDHRKIVRFHAGSQLECNYSLRSFGIPHEDVTITDGHNIKTKHIPKFLNARKSIEAHRERRERALRQRKKLGLVMPELDDLGKDEGPGIECPGVDCIVFGDKAMHAHPANVEFRELLRVMEREREEQSQQNNTVLPIKEFIEHIIATARSDARHEYRFLVFDKSASLFVDITDQQELCKRVSQALRDQRKRARIEEKRQLAASVPRPVPSSLATVEAVGSSIMGLDAARRSYGTAGGGAANNGGDANCFFCMGGSGP